MQFESLFDRRVILVSGKGGVGRTVFSAALAKAAAQLGKRVLLADIGTPDEGDSPLANIFQKDSFSKREQYIAENLYACHLWAPRGHQLFLRAVLPGGAIIGAALKSKALQTFMQAAPSMLEMGWFYHLLTLIKTERAPGIPEYETIIIDLPATGHTLALTGLPNILLRLINHGPIRSALKEGQGILNSPFYTAAWIVTLPEMLPISEALELRQGLMNTEVPVGGFILNRIPNDPFSPEERSQLDSYVHTETMLGALDFYRIQASHEAKHKLHEQVEQPIIHLHEYQESQQGIVQNIAEHLVSLEEQI